MSHLFSPHYVQIILECCLSLITIQMKNWGQKGDFYLVITPSINVVSLLSVSNTLYKIIEGIYMHALIGQKAKNWFIVLTNLYFLVKLCVTTYTCFIKAIDHIFCWFLGITHIYFGCYWKNTSQESHGKCSLLHITKSNIFLHKWYYSCNVIATSVSSSLDKSEKQKKTTLH